MYTIKGPTIDGFETVLNLHIDRELQPEYANLEKFASHRSAMVRNSLPETASVDKNRLIRLDETDAWEYLLRWALNPDVVQYVQTIYAIRQGFGLTFSCRYSDGAFRALRDKVNLLVGMFLR